MSLLRKRHPSTGGKRAVPALRLSLSLMLLMLCTPLAAERLVVAGGAITEVIYALGAEDQLIAVDSTSTWPPEARNLPRVGYVRALPVEGILALKPDRLLVAPEAGPERARRQLERVVPVTRITSAWEPDAVVERVRQIAELLDRREQGERLASQLEQEFAEIERRLPLDRQPRVLFLLATGGHGLLVGGRDTQAQALLDALQLPNAAEQIEGFKPLNAEAALALRPELIVVAETAEGAFRLEDWPALQHRGAGRSGRVLVRDSMFLLSFGPRLPQAMEAVLAAARGRDGRTAWLPR
ncbi:MAG: ABC transporter substrate-binding protein [Ectothiorhodospiraceae bacterium]|nr:ABC transporter substrate-binding protein [Ectothiorhodospiraceae bacterium]